MLKSAPRAASRLEAWHHAHSFAFLSCFLLVVSWGGPSTFLSRAWVCVSRIVGVIVCGCICVSTCVFLFYTYFGGPTTFSLPYLLLHTYTLHIQRLRSARTWPARGAVFPNVKFHFDRVWMVAYSLSCGATEAVFSICACSEVQILFTYENLSSRMVHWRPRALFMRSCSCGTTVAVLYIYSQAQIVFTFANLSSCCIIYIFTSSDCVHICESF